MLHSILSRLTGSGWRTSEFFVAILALVMPVMDRVVGALTHTWAASPAWPLQLAAVLLAAAYAWARARVKVNGTSRVADLLAPVYATAPDYTITPSGNVVMKGPGSPQAEEAVRAAAVARANI